MTMNIDTAEPRYILNYLNYLYDIAWEKSGHQETDADWRITKSHKIDDIWLKVWHIICRITPKLNERFDEYITTNVNTGKSKYEATWYDHVVAYINEFEEFVNKYENNPCNFMFPTFEEYIEKEYDN